LVGPVPKLSADSAPIAGAAPLLGQHSGEVLEQVLGYTKQDVARLKAGGVIAEHQGERST
jgi:crotonobetainyl-CoA:carnitine CoA-transferase CaiB-like acyl-CoA transferase